MLARVEVARTSRRVNPEAALAARHLMESVDLVPLGAEVVEQAALLPHEDLRSLDAIQLASALTIRPALEWFVSNNRRLSACAVSVWLPLLSPGT